MSDHLLPLSSTQLERNLSLATARVADFDPPIDLVRRAQDIPEKFLPWLAWELSVDDWDNSWTVAQKRNVIEQSVEIHRRKGTFGAVRRALEALGYGVVINENTGVPYTFRIAINQNGVTNPDEALFQEAERVALKTKNARSALLGVDVLLESEGTFQISVAATHGFEVTIYPPVNLLFETDHFPIMGVAVQHVDTVTLRN